MKKLSQLLLSFVLIASLTSCAPITTQNQTGDNGSFFVHFIDVGQADAALVQCDGKAMLIDGGNAADSDLVYTYLKKQQIEYLDYVVCSHAHEDHVGGLSGALATLRAGRVFAPEAEADSKAYLNFKRKVEGQGLAIEHPQAGSSFQLGSSTVRFLGPITQDADELNNTSIVMKITYGATSFLFTGDAEREEEQEILNAGYDLSATVLKVGHHGAENSTTYPFLREIMPQYGVISVGAKNPYNHPSAEALSRLRDAGVKVYRTDLQGDVIAASDGTYLTFTAAKNADAAAASDTVPAQVQQSPPPQSAASDYQIQNYIGSRSTRKFHLPSCRSLPDEKNRVLFSEREQALRQGFTPCGSCNP